MLKVIFVLIILVLIVLLRQQMTENFSSLSEIMVNTGLDSATLSKNAKEMLSSNNVPLGDPSINDEVLSLLLKKSILYNDGKSVFSNEITEEQADDPEFYIKIMDQDHKIFTETTNQRMLIDNLMNELRKLAKNSTPISVLARKYTFNNIENPDNNVTDN
tara:strand:- start:34 stop:513 length:480 start_codon:yes stop_codon:yes gene_type:complete